MAPEGLGNAAHPNGGWMDLFLFGKIAIKVRIHAF